MKQTPELKEQIIDYIYNNDVSLNDVCRAFNITNVTIYKWQRDDIEFKKGIQEAQQSKINLAEDVLIRAMKSDDIKTAVKAAVAYLRWRTPKQVDITSNGETIVQWPSVIKLVEVNGQQIEKP